MTAAQPDEAAEGAFSLTWWLEDTERWDLLWCEADHDEAGLPLDRWWKDRRNVLDELIRAPGPADHDFARFLLEQERRFHRHCWGFSHSIEIAALLLAEHHRPDDIWLLWQAITTSFDTWCGIPHRLLFAGGGTARTVAYVTKSSHPQRDNLLEHLHQIPEATSENVATLIADRRQYHADALNELDANHSPAPSADDFGNQQHPSPIRPTSYGQRRTLHFGR